MTERQFISRQSDRATDEKGQPDKLDKQSMIKARVRRALPAGLAFTRGKIDLETKYLNQSLRPAHVRGK